MLKKLIVLCSSSFAFLNIKEWRYFMRIIIIITAITFLLSACTDTQNEPHGNVNSLVGLEQLNAIGYNNALGGSATGSMSSIRYMAIKETALSVGARAALSWRSREIDE